MSQRLFTHASPTLFNAGTPRSQLSSCFLLSMKEDSIEGIYDTLKQVKRKGHVFAEGSTSLWWVVGLKDVELELEGGIHVACRARFMIAFCFRAFVFGALAFFGGGFSAAFSCFSRIVSTMVEEDVTFYFLEKLVFNQH